MRGHFFQLSQNNVRYLPRRLFAFLFRDGVNIETVRIFPVKRKGIELDQVLSSDQIFQNPAVTAKETAVDKHDFSCVPDPLRQCRSGYGEQFPVATSSVRLLLRNQVGGKTGDRGTYMFIPHGGAEVKEIGTETGGPFFTRSLPLVADIEMELKAARHAA